MGVRHDVRAAFSRRVFRSRLLPANRSFTVVSNNCWGAHLYQELGIEYLTPFVGLFLQPACFLRLLEGWDRLMNERLGFAAVSKYESITEFRRAHGQKYPIGLLGGEVEVHFLHYDSERTAREKWARRRGRMAWDRERLFVKFCDHDGPSEGELRAFEQVAFPNRVCFVGQMRQDLEHSIYVPGCDGQRVPDGLVLSRLSYRYFDAVDWLEGGEGRPKWWSRALGALGCFH